MEATERPVLTITPEAAARIQTVAEAEGVDLSQSFVRI